MLNPAQTIITQYQTSPILNAVLTDLNANLDPTANLLNFYGAVWNVTTASGYGLDVWGRIVGVTRNLQSLSTYSYFNFNGVPGATPFGVHVFYAGSALTGAVQITLSDASFRQLILLKALANTTDCSVPQINAILAGLYGDQGVCYVIDNEDMSFTYRFKFSLTTTDAALLYNSGVLPRPAGVTYSIVQGA